MQSVKSAWQFMWKNKIVWGFGIFAAFLGQFGVVEFLGKMGFVASDVGGYFNSLVAIGKEACFLGFGLAIPFEGKMLVLFLLVLLAGLALLFIFIAVVSQGAIIYLSAQSIKGKDKPDIAKSWHISSANFWRLFFINAFKKLLVVILSIFVALSAYAALIIPTVANGLLFLLVFLIAAAVGMVLSFLVIYSASYVVVERYSVYEAIKSAWRLFTGHWLVSIEVGLIVLIFNLFLGLISALGFILVILPAILLWLAVALVGGGQLLLTAALIAGVIFFTMYLIAIGAGFTVFTIHIWTFIFMKMHKEGVKSRILHYLSHKKVRI